MDDRESIELAERVEALLGEIEALPDDAARGLATDAVGALVALYGEGLIRIRDHLDPALAAELCEDDLVSHLMMVHGLHPASTEERITDALATVKPYLESHGGGVELLGVAHGTARLRLRGSCSGCPSSAITLKLAVEDAIRKHAPEVESIEAEGAEDEHGASPPSQLLQIENVRPNGECNEGGEGWAVVGGLPELRDGGTTVREVSGERLLFAALGEERYAYRPRCPACEGSLAEGELDGAELRCPGCGSAYDLRRAGRCLDSPQLHLDPVPLLVAESGVARVATGAAA